jgi:uncharacterized protein YndB with AHSA1/START domain
MITFETNVRIERPIDQVFSYVSDPGNLPHWNSAVQTVGRTSADGSGELGSTYSMTRALPTGNAANDLEVIAHEHPREFAIRTTSGPTPFVYRFRFTPQNDATIVGLEAALQLGRAANSFASLARRAVRQGVDENLATLKTTLEETR